MGAIALKTSEKTTGFTLIELLITMGIVGILVMVALPSYQSYVLQSHRSAAINSLLYLASQEANFFVTQNSYSATLAGLGGGYSDPYPVSVSGTTYYNIYVQTGSTTGTGGFILQAVPTGTQINDTTCGIFAYSNLGIKALYSYTGSPAITNGVPPAASQITTTATLTTCWGN